MLGLDKPFKWALGRHFSAVVDVSVDDAFDAACNLRSLDEWLLDVSALSSSDQRAQVGSTIEATSHYENTSVTSTLEVVELVLNRRLVLSWGDFGGARQLSAEFAPAPSGVRIDVREERRKLGLPMGIMLGIFPPLGALFLLLFAMARPANNFFGRRKVRRLKHVVAEGVAARQTALAAEMRAARRCQHRAPEEVERLREAALDRNEAIIACICCRAPTTASEARCEACRI